MKFRIAFFFLLWRVSLELGDYSNEYRSFLEKYSQFHKLSALICKHEISFHLLVSSVTSSIFLSFHSRGILPSRVDWFLEVAVWFAFLNSFSMCFPLVYRNVSDLCMLTLYPWLDESVYEVQKFPGRAFSWLCRLTWHCSSHFCFSEIA